MKRAPFYFAVGLVAIYGIVFSVACSSNAAPTTFVTWDSLEPDQWSSIWLIKRHIDPHAIIEIHPTGEILDDGIAFGVPQADYQRSGNQSTFESLLVGFNQQDPALKQLGRIITAIETTAWNSASDPLVHTVERHFRRLQDIYNRAYVPISCYGHFFDALYAALAQPSAVNPNALDDALGAAVANSACEESLDMAKRKRANRVKELAIDQLLSEIALDNNVVFVDTREPAEFSKSHIPGAMNIPMRNLSTTVYEQLRKADRVISYCVKDFRGYEVARQLLENGVSSVAVMKPHGLAGWQSLNLPIASAKLSDERAQQQLKHCAKDRSSCTNR